MKTAPETSPAEAPKAEEPKAPSSPDSPNPPPAPAASEEKKKSESAFPVHGYISARYRGRWAGDQEDDRENSDQDVYLVSAMDAGDKARNPVTLHVMARAAFDLDGEADQTGFFVFDSLDDTYDHRLTGRLYHAYMDIHAVKWLDVVRVGRQFMHETPELAYFDGGRIETKEQTDIHFKVGVYGGVPVHLYESSPDGDNLLGAFVQVRPWTAGRLRIDGMHVNDETFYGKHRDDLLGFSGWQGLGEYIDLHVRYTRLENMSRDLTLRASFDRPDWDFRIQYAFYELIHPQREFSVEFDPFFSATFDLEPYLQHRVLASKGFGEHVVVEGGIDSRRLLDLSDKGPFNRDFDRYYLTPSVRNWPVKGLSFSLTGEIWNGDDRDLTTGGGDITYEFSKKFRASVGSFYSLYRYDYYADQERDDVRTYYLKLRYHPAEAWRIDAGYEFEDDAFDRYHQATLGVTWSF